MCLKPQNDINIGLESIASTNLIAQHTDILGT